jgi:hypothetical protein
MNPFFTLRDQLLTQPEEKRKLLARAVSGTTTDTRRKCGCLFGTLHSQTRAEKEGLAPNPSCGGGTTVYGRYRYEERFQQWADSLGFPQESVQEQLCMLEQMNDENVPGSKVPSTVDNTESACRARFTRMVDTLTQLGEEWETKHVQG